MTTLVKTSQQQICLLLFNNSTIEGCLHLPISDSFKIVIFFNVLFLSLRVKSKELLYHYICVIFFVGSSADEQNLSKKAIVICHDEKPSPSEKCLHKGTLFFESLTPNTLFAPKMKLSWSHTDAKKLRHI